MANGFYSSLRWKRAAARARARDGNACTVARLLGGRCSSGTPHVHHVQPVAEGGDPFDLVNLATVCASHHPVWESLRRRLLANLRPPEERPVRCRHFHRTLDARLQCEARLAREAERRLAAA